MFVHIYCLFILCLLSVESARCSFGRGCLKPILSARGLRQDRAPLNVVVVAGVEWNIVTPPDWTLQQTPAHNLCLLARGLVRVFLFLRLGGGGGSSDSRFSTTQSTKDACVRRVCCNTM